MTDREYRRLEARKSAEAETSRTGRTVNQPINPRRLSAFDQGQQQRDDDDQFAAGYNAGPTGSAGAFPSAVKRMPPTPQPGMSTSEQTATIRAAGGNIEVNAYRGSMWANAGTYSAARATHSAAPSLAGVHRIEGPAVTHDSTASVSATALRRRYDAQEQERGIAAKQQATAALKDENSRREAEFRTKGIKHYVDNGEIKAELDETGAPRFATSAWQKGKAADGSPALTRRNERGQTEFRKPKVTASGDIRDPNLYYDFGAEGKQAAGHADDLIHHSDPDVARAASTHRTNRNKVSLRRR